MLTYLPERAPSFINNLYQLSKRNQAFFNILFFHVKGSKSSPERFSRFDLAINHFENCFYGQNNSNL